MARTCRQTDGSTGTPFSRFSRRVLSVGEESRAQRRAFCFEAQLQQHPQQLFVKLAVSDSDGHPPNLTNLL
jgi:hypothetical protein